MVSQWKLNLVRLWRIKKYMLLPYTKINKYHPIKTASIITFGCKVNQKDSEKWLAFLLQHHITINNTHPDIIVINTCTVTDKADKKALSTIKQLKKKYPQSIIIATGCGVKKENSEYYSLKEINYIIPNFLEKEAIAHLFTSPSKKITPFSPKDNRTRALIQIQEGCENYCSFCIVPFVRGCSKSRSMEDIIREIREKEKRGFLEIVITGINIGAYGCSKTNKPSETKLAELLQKIVKETSIPRIRLSSLGPQYITPQLIETCTNSRICNHIHLSLQSGSDAVLQKMNRPYRAKDIYNISKELQKKIPLVSFTADIIVGFPGETEKDFKASCSVAEQIPLSKIHVFPYSKRSGTKASILQNHISLTEKLKRAKILRNVSDVLQKKQFENMVGKKLSVLFEYKNNNPYQGWSTNYYNVKVKSKNILYNTIQNIQITGREEQGLQGILL